MSGSDTESSCGWTFISNEGSDIETLGTEEVESSLVIPVPQKVELPDGDHVELKEDVLEDTLVDTEKVPDPDPPETGIDAATNEHVSVLSSSDHSDILTFGDIKDDELVSAEASDDLYLGMSCSSQYTFTSAQTVLPVQTLGLPSSSEDEPDLSSGVAVRRRRVRRNTPNTEPAQEVMDPSESVMSGQEQTEAKPRGQGILTACAILTLVIAFSTGFGRFYSTNQTQTRKTIVDEVSLNQLDELRDLLFQTGEQKTHLSLNELDFPKAISVFSEAIYKMIKDNDDLGLRYAQIQDQRNELELLLKEMAEEKRHMESQHQSLLEENHELLQALEEEGISRSVLVEDLKTLRMAVINLEAVKARGDSLQSENKRLKAELEQEKDGTRSFSAKREALMNDAKMLREKLDHERTVTDKLRGEIDQLQQQIDEAEETKDLESRLVELEGRLSFEQQRSDMWERLYLETKERAKGDEETKRTSKSKQGPAGKVKETFDTMKNSTKEFVRHHKKKIEEAKVAVKENLRKFSESLKSTFRNFKDSASTILNKAQGFYDRKRNDRKEDETGKRRSGKPTKKTLKFNFDFLRSNHFSRNSEDEVHKKFKPQSCSEVFDCAYQEFMSLFNKAADPIRADEFHQLLQSYLQKEFDYFPHWKKLEIFINNFFHNGLFIHDQMLFADFVNDLEDYLTDLYKHQGLNEDFFEDLDDYIYRHFFGDAYSQNSRPR
ncbi:unnamed protein product [Knipowitschia caucasica]|uniref:Cell cycle progression protein 1 n=1 Tax=Knipowitschia caucasica TaxID=637954 RepID=A0AAV2LP05_KNICA